MVLRHASERFRLAYELPLETYELFGASNQFSNVTVDDLDENSYRLDILSKHDLWRKNKLNELIDYQTINEDFYNNDFNEDEIPDYAEENSPSSSSSLYQWHRDRHFDVNNIITKYVDDKMYVRKRKFYFEIIFMFFFLLRINITVLEFVKNLPQFNRSDYQSARLPFDLFRPYAYLLEEKYRGRTGNYILRHLD
jgi:hypothetical protein